jgi:hypothetical protein
MSDTIWGAANIGRAAGIVDENGEVDLRKTFWQLESGNLPGRKIGRRWISSVSALHAALEVKLNATAE